MMLLKITLFGVFGVMQCVYVVRGSKNTLFSTYCCQSSVVCHVFPPHVSLFGLFPVLV